MICPACNHKFDPESSSVGCGACLMHGSCGLVKCPECGYETPREPGFLGRMLKAFGRTPVAEVVPDQQHCLVEDSATRAARGLDEPEISAQQGGSTHEAAPAATTSAARTGTTLASLRQGDTAFIERFAAPEHARKFLSLGILPGTSITVLKQFPAIVLRVGYSEFAFDRKLASTVIVRR